MGSDPPPGSPIVLRGEHFARHANSITTVAYTHPSDEELYAAIREVKR